MYIHSALTICIIDTYIINTCIIYLCIINTNIMINTS